MSFWTACDPTSSMCAPRPRRTPRWPSARSRRAFMCWSRSRSLRARLKPTGCAPGPERATGRFQRWLPLVTRLGVLLSVDFAVCSAGASSRPGAEADRVVMDILPHPLSLFERVHPGSLKEISWQVLRPRSGELRASGVSRGTVFTLSISMNGRPPRNELIVTGEEGTLHADLFHGFAVRESPRNSRGYKIARPLALSARH